ncbi:alpha/beta fold hydrolase [Chitinophaga silvatica]|uniref:Alpha/beta fold hydrolase n=1 Tax=Chitinophaga silvatica TaxID=2282649 RepID=A0A3E1YH75_9BACT|nr:alpha/beta fold hydrolase [Chitinophaga silvatica]RFS26722.1 alpha/beta fold hydrolase [Chitinophaga silvatica]
MKSPNEVRPTIVLIHGAGHGSWCWQKVTPLLEASGFNVMALDLPGCSNDLARLTGITLADSVRTVMDAANTVSDKVVLLGHSSGGVVISQAAEWLGAEKIEKLIYLDAFLPQDGESVFSLAQKLKESTLPSATQDTVQPELLIFEENGKACMWNPAVVEQIFYHDCLPEDIAFAKSQLSWESIASLATPVELSNEIYGTIAKYYILCEEAQDLNKSSLPTFVHCENVYKLPSSHSPFFSMPHKLVEILIDIHK